MARCNKTATHGSCGFPCFFHVSHTTIVRKGEAVAASYWLCLSCESYQPPLRENEPLHRYCADYTGRCWGKDWAILGGVLAPFVNLLAIHNDIFGGADTDPHFSPLDFHDRYVLLMLFFLRGTRGFYAARVISFSGLAERAARIASKPSRLFAHT
jgi:hypothetical protein